MSKLPINKTVLIISAIALYNCSTEDKTTAEKDTEKPVVTISNIQQVALDADVVKDDVTFVVKATDNKGVVNKVVTVNGTPATENQGVYSARNLNMGTENLILAEADDAAGNTGMKEQKVTLEAPGGEFALNLEYNVYEDQIVDGAPVGTVLADNIDSTITLDGVEKTIAELEAEGYTVDLGLEANEYVAKQGDQIVVIKELDRDGVNNTDPANLATVSTKLNFKVSKDGAVVTSTEKNFYFALADQQDWTPTTTAGELSMVAEHADGSAYKEFTDVKNIHDINEQVAISPQSIQEIINASNGVIVGEVLSDGNLYPKIASGPHAGKYLTVSKTLESLRSAMSAGINGSEAYASDGYATSANNNIGALLGEYIANGGAVTEYTSSAGVVSITPTELDKIAGLAIVGVYNDLGVELNS